MKKLAFIVFLSFLFLFSCYDHNTAEEELAQTVAEMNKKCPQIIDSETRLDHIDVKHPNTLVYKYTLLNLNIALIDTHAFRMALWPGLLSTIRVSPEMQKLRDDNVTIEYAYSDKNRQPVYVFRITPKDYK